VYRACIILYNIQGRCFGTNLERARNFLSIMGNVHSCFGFLNLFVFELGSHMLRTDQWRSQDLDVGGGLLEVES